MDRLDRIEGILAEVSIDLKRMSGNFDQTAADFKEVRAILKDVAARQQEMAARQQYHDEAFERFDAEMKVIRENGAADGERIRALVRIAELHNRRLDRLEGGETA